MQSKYGARQLAVTLMWAQAGVALVGLTVKTFLIFTGRTVPWESSTLPTLSIFVLASALLSPILALSISRGKRWGRSAAVVMESAVAIYSVIAAAGIPNASQLFNAMISIAIVYLLVSRP